MHAPYRLLGQRVWKSTPFSSKYIYTGQKERFFTAHRGPSERTVGEGEAPGRDSNPGWAG